MYCQKISIMWVCLRQCIPLMAKNETIKSYIPWKTPAMVKAINGEVEKLEKAGFIEPSISTFAAPTVCVRKKDGSLRVYIDFRMVNKIY